MTADSAVALALLGAVMFGGVMGWAAAVYHHGYDRNGDRVPTHRDLRRSMKRYLKTL